MLKRAPFAVLAAAGLLAAPHASAQMKPFAGGGLGFNTVAADSTLQQPLVPDEKTTSGKSNLAFQIEGGVRFDNPGPMVWGVGLYISPLALKADEQDDGAGTTTKTEVKNLMGLFGELGWKLGSATVAYGRLSFNQAKVESKLVQPGGPNGTVSKSFTGIGLGAGVRHALAGNRYLFADWHHIMGSEVKVTDATLMGTDTIKITPTITTGLIGMGWTF